jgi:hypothetical protein
VLCSQEEIGGVGFRLYFFMLRELAVGFTVRAITG